MATSVQNLPAAQCYVVMETKICEFCGKMFLRERDSGERYCSSHRELEPIHRGKMAAISLARVRARLLEEFRRAMSNGGFGSARAVALADAIGLLDCAAQRPLELRASSSELRAKAAASLERRSLSG